MAKKYQIVNSNFRAKKYAAYPNEQDGGVMLADLFHRCPSDRMEGYLAC